MNAAFDSLEMWAHEHRMHTEGMCFDVQTLRLPDGGEFAVVLLGPSAVAAIKAQAGRVTSRDGELVFIEQCRPGEREGGIFRAPSNAD